MKTCIIVGAGGRGKDCYAPYLKKAGILKIVGVAEPDENRRTQFARDYDIPDVMCFADYKELFAKGKLADSVIICTQDKTHLEATRLAVDCQYQILLEKPIATTLGELEKIESLISGYDKIFTTGFVLRYTPFIKKIKEIIKSGEIGGRMEAGTLVLKRFSDMSEEKFNIVHDETKHCGGDGGLMQHFAKLLCGEPVPDKWVLKAHKAVFAAEQSRITGSVIEL